MTRNRLHWSLGASLLLAATAATPQPLPCSSVSPEVRDYVRSRGACRDPKPARRPRTSTASDASGIAASTRANLPVPRVLGLSFVEASRELTRFKVERSETTSAAPAGEVLAQEPAPDALGRPGSVVLLTVSDGSLAIASSASPVTSPAAAGVASAAPPGTLPPLKPTDGPSAPGLDSSALLAPAALLFGAGLSLGLLTGALLMRGRASRNPRAAGERAAPSAQSQGQQPGAPPPVGLDAGGLAQASASTEVRFAARLVPSATTIALAPSPDTAGSASSLRSTTLPEQIRLHCPIEVSSSDVERALFEQCKDEFAVAQVFERLRGGAAERAAEELNDALDIDILDVLAQGWIQVPAVHRAVQLSALTRKPPVLVDVERHTIASSSRIVLDTRVAQDSLPPLELALEILADIRGATLAACDGRIDPVELGEAKVVARLKYKGMPVMEQSTVIAGGSREPSETQPPPHGRPPSIDFRI